MSTLKNRMPDDSRRIVALDGLRGIAIAMVLWQHMAKPYLPESRHSFLGWLRGFTELSWAGVDLFFVLSGFFIGGILIDGRMSSRLGRVFYLRRALRILPLYYIALAIIVAAIWSHMPGIYNLFPFWVYVLFVPNVAFAFAGSWDCLPLSILWSLSVEEQFYLVAPWVVRCITPRTLPWLMGGLALLAWAMRAGLMLIYPSGQFATHLLMPFRMDTLALGIVVAWATRHQPAHEFICSFYARHRWAILGFVGAAMILLCNLSLEHPNSGSPALCLYGYTLIAWLCAIFVALIAIVRPPVLLTILGFRPLTHLGRHSYFIYLFHPIIGLGIIRFFGGEGLTLDSYNGIAIVVFAVGATWGAAAISWRWLERPLI